MTSPISSPLIPTELVEVFTQIIKTLAKSSQHAYWYARRAEGYLCAMELRPVSLQGNSFIEGYLPEPGRKLRLSGRGCY